MTPLLLLFLSVFVLTIVHNSANRWSRLGRDFNKVHAILFGDPQGIFGCHNTQLLTVAADYPYFSGNNLLVDSGLINLPSLGSSIKTDAAPPCALGDLAKLPLLQEARLPYP